MSRTKSRTKSIQHLVGIALLAVGVADPAAADEPATAAADTTPGPEVAWALSYELPAHDCKRPKLRNSNQPDAVSKFERKTKRYVKCVVKYQTAIIEDHQKIIAAAEQGVTTEQAETLVAHLRAIEAAVVELGEDSTVTLDPLEAERLLSVGNRPSI